MASIRAEKVCVRVCVVCVHKGPVFSSVFTLGQHARDHRCLYVYIRTHMYSSVGVCGVWWCVRARMYTFHARTNTVSHSHFSLRKF